jgi:hypothetical protein
MEVDSKPQALLFASRTGSTWSRRNILRDVKLLCKKLGFTPPGRTLHAFRHHADFVVMPTCNSESMQEAHVVRWESA